MRSAFKTGFLIVILVSFKIHALISQTLIHSSDIFERIIIQTDNNLYVAGETIVFNIASLDNVSNIPVDFSKIVYIELYTQNNLPVVQKKILLSNGFANGNIDIPRNVHEKSGLPIILQPTNQNYKPIR